jgi:VWFA-related protein
MRSALVTPAFGTLALVWLMAAGVATTPKAQDRPAPAETQTFRSSVKLIDIDVFVHDKDGHNVRGLTRDDFEIIEDDQVQELRAFTFVDLPTASPSPAVNELVEPDVVTNRGPRGRLYVIVLDSPSTASPSSWLSGQSYDVLVKRLADRFVDENLQTGDLAAVVNPQGTYSDSTSFTASKEGLHAAIARYGRGRSGNIENIENLDAATRSIQTYETIGDVAARLGAINGRRKAILLIGSQMRFQSPECPAGASSQSLACQIASRWPAITAAYRDAVTAATRNNVAVYTIDPSGLTTDTGAEEMDRRAALQVVAEDTGGIAVVGTNNFATAFTDIVRDTSTYYVLGYVPASDYRDGKFHQVKVRVRRPGFYSVRARKGYTAPAPEKAPAPGTKELPAIVTAGREALAMPIPVQGLDVSLFTAPFKGTNGNAEVIIGGRISGDLLLENGQATALSYQVFTEDNKVQTGAYKVFTLNVKPGSRDTIEAHGMHFIDQLSLPAGQYELRYAVNQAGGGVGSVVVPLRVPRFDETLSVSGMILMSPATADRFMVVRSPAEFLDRLEANPTSERAFRAEDTIRAYVEVYAGDVGRSPRALTVTGHLTAASGTVIAEVNGQLQSGTPASGGLPYIIEFALDEIRDLPAGRYVLSVDVASRENRVPLVREIPITVVN